MKKMSFSLTLLLFVFSVFGQSQTNTQFSKDQYLQTSKDLRTLGWVFAGAGTFIGAIGITLEKGAVKDPGTWFTAETYENSVAKDILTVGGAALIAGCVPLFRVATIYKRKAAGLGFKNQQLPFPHKNSLVSKTQSTISLKIPL